MRPLLEEDRMDRRLSGEGDRRQLEEIRRGSSASDMEEPLCDDDMMYLIEEDLDDRDQQYRVTGTRIA
jgi:hypothetical protein